MLHCCVLLQVAFIYETSFWTEKGLSGTAFSRGGSLGQVWDASSRPGGGTQPPRHALSSFVFGDDLKHLSDEGTIRASPIMEQLVSMFGEEAANPSRIVFKSWQSDPYTQSKQQLISASGGRDVPFGHPLVSGAVEGIVFSGTETALYENGHMNGAVIAGDRAAAEALALLHLS
jgi:monoamine oxidase